MKRYDMHIHAENTTPVPNDLLERMDKAGIYGGCVFSHKPIKGYPGRGGLTFAQRLAELHAWTDEHRDRLFPVAWIHPYEDGIHEFLHEAAENGVMGFKIICTDFYIYEDPCLQVLSEIAALNKPVFFHSGIVWNGANSSQYNKPLNWEALVDVPRLRFSMGHCSWPWHDECIALYGKFLNALTLKEDCAEMFFDLTPGTPMIYREELLRKIFTVGYDVPDNILFGTDANAYDYNSSWTAEWLRLDGEIMDKLGVTEDIKQKIYCDNLMRFLGLKEKDFQHIRPACDRFQSWYPGVNRNDIKN